MSPDPPGTPPAGELAGALRDRFRQGPDTPLSDAEFDALARRVFSVQFGADPVLSAFAESRGIPPGGTVGHWTEVPLIPTAGFRRVRIGPPGLKPEAVFRTSGTTGGGRGEHRVPDLTLYRDAALPHARRRLFPDSDRLRLLSLVPSSEALPDSSLSTMVDMFRGVLAVPGGGTFLHPSSGYDLEGLTKALRECEADGTPALLVGTAFAFVHWLDHAESSAERLSLPLGSRVMETGGFKGRSRVVSREALYTGLSERLGIPVRMMVGEYGMTELLSQAWEPGMRRAARGDPGPLDEMETRWFRFPPWVRSRVLDPVTLEEAPHGTVGLLAHFDLANLYSACHVLTEDLGVASEQGFRVLGRAGEAELRGCSLTAEELAKVAGGPQ